MPPSQPALPSSRANGRGGLRPEGLVRLTEEPVPPEALAGTLANLDELVPDAVPRHAPSRWLRRVLVGLDLGALAMAWTAALVAVPAVSRSERPLGTSALAAASLTGLALWLMAAQGLYLSRVCNIRAMEATRLCRVAALTAVTAVVGSDLAGTAIGLREAALGAFLSLVLLFTVRGGYRSWLCAKRREGRHLTSLLLIGANEEAAEIFRLLETHPEHGYAVAGVVGDEDEARANGLRHRWLGPLDDLTMPIDATGAQGAVMAVSAMRSTQLNATIRRLLHAGIQVHLSSGVWGVSTRRLRAMPLAYEPLFYLEPVSLARRKLRVKRALDVVVALAAIVLTAPVLAVCAVAVKLHDGGPVLFRQQRVGRDGRLFSLYKLRTMVVDAEGRRGELADLNQREWPLFKSARDPRVTPVGRFLRATSVDELPQLVNVLKGTMSLVGPRPALPEETVDFDEALQARTSVRPGITGLWQVEARDNPSFGAYRRYDLFYVENWSVGLDLVILLATVESVVARVLGALRDGSSDSGSAPSPVASNGGPPVAHARRRLRRRVVLRH